MSTVGVCMSAHVASSQVVRFVHVTLCVFLACDVTSSPLLCFVLLSDATLDLEAVVEHFEHQWIPWLLGGFLHHASTNITNPKLM